MHSHWSETSFFFQVLELICFLNIYYSHFLVFLTGESKTPPCLVDRWPKPKTARSRVPGNGLLCITKQTKWHEKSLIRELCEGLRNLDVWRWVIETEAIESQTNNSDICRFVGHWEHLKKNQIRGRLKKWTLKYRWIRPYYWVNRSIEVWKSLRCTARRSTYMGSYNCSQTTAFGTYIPCCIDPLASKLGAL